ncbi:MAG: class I SAM-dependent methyltransferase [Elusimicrobia bacterium]|nr:class I SAM-dependent methyltransferase [Elusimicrobiota bacterium]
MASTSPRAQYDRFGAAYHAKRRSRAGGFYNDFLDLPALTALLKEDVRGRDVLDLGCGAGLFTRRLAGWGARAVGLDQSRTMLELARRENPGLTFVQGSAARLPFRARRFDVAASALMAHYLRDLRPLFRETARVLRPGGLWVFSFHHPLGELLKVDRPRRRASLGPYFHGRAYEWSMGPMRLRSFHHTFEAVFEALGAAGFVVERLLEPRPPTQARRVDPSSYAATRDFPAFCALRARLR